MSKPGEMVQILREAYEEQLEAYRLLRNKFLIAVPGMDLNKEKQLYDQWKLDLHLNSIISFDRALPSEPRTCETCDQVFDWIKKNTGWTIRDPETGEINRSGETYKQLFDIVSRSPQSADVETVREALVQARAWTESMTVEYKCGLALAALDRLAGKEEK